MSDMDSRTKAFEDFMQEYFDEAEWYEGYNRGEMWEAFQAGVEYIMQKEKGHVE